MKGGRLITPLSLRDEMLEKIHGSHQGVGTVTAGQERVCFVPM